MNKKFLFLFLFLGIVLFAISGTVALALAEDPNTLNESEDLGSESYFSGSMSAILQATGAQGASLKVCLDYGCCSFCDFLTVGGNIFRFLRNDIALPLAVLMMVYGGIVMMMAGSNPANLKKGQMIITNSLVGFALVLAVSVILNTILLFIAKSPATYKGVINGQFPANFSCYKDCGSFQMKDPGGVGDEKISLSPKVKNVLDDLELKYKIITTSTTGGKHTEGSYHYKGMAADFVTNNKDEWDSIVSYLNGRGVYAFCDSGGKKVSCAEATHIHFDLRKGSGDY